VILTSSKVCDQCHFIATNEIAVSLTKMHATSHTLNEMFEFCQAHVVFFKILPKCKKNPVVLPTNAFCEIFGPFW